MDHVFTGNNWKYISRRLKMRLLLFLVIAIVLISFAGYEIAIGDMTLIEGAVSFALGILVGYVYGRLLRVRWNADEEKVVQQMDATGYILIAAYVLLSLSRDWLLGHFFSGIALAAIGATLAGGLLIGRFMGIQVSLLRTIRENR